MTKTAPVISHESANPSIGNDKNNKRPFRTRTFIVKGFDARGAWKEMRVTAANRDHAIGIAHERGIRVAECVQMNR